MFELNVNDVIKAEGDGAPFQGFARLLAVRGKFAYLIGLPLTSGNFPRIIRYRLKAPFRVRVRELARAIDAGLVDNGFRLDGGLLHSEDQYDGLARKKLEENCNLILPLLEDENQILESPERGEALRGGIPNGIGRKASESALRRLRRILYIFLANGRTSVSLAPAFHLRGAVMPQCPGTKRRGRRSKESDGSEIALPEVRDRLIAGCKRFYRTGRYTMAEAYVETLQTYFKAEIRRLPGGSLQTAQLPVPYLPTERQFRYICDLQDRRLGKRLKKPRKARPEAVQEIRRGRARDGVDGPGCRFEIDATGLQIQLVSCWDPQKLVGAPWLYLVIDVWSGLIAGYVLSLEDPAGSCRRRPFGAAALTRRPSMRASS